MDIGWGGVPRQIPSDIALKYLNEFSKVLVSHLFCLITAYFINEHYGCSKAEHDLPAGSHLRSSRIMEEEVSTDFII